MQKMLLSLLLLISLVGSLALEDLEGKALVFPEASDTAHARLKTTIQQPLTSFTLCLRYLTEIKHIQPLFSYASKRTDNEILLNRNNIGYELYIEGLTKVDFTVPEILTSNSVGEHVCVSWESATGLVELWVNEKPLVRKSLQKGHSVSAEGSIVIGQEQDTFGGGFDINQSFVGEITDLYMWDRILCPDEVVLAFHNYPLPGYLINWRSLSYSIRGYALVKPVLLSAQRAG
ncbi:serum amyloid P-component-like [Sphaerodactylus townsendi]|nr:serum amyloid P-component-like [Sphaerodactylus townsendi]